jgi:hypothetical protein
MKHMTVDSYGNCLKNIEHPAGMQPGGVSKRKLLREYKFDLAFENVLEEAWITEKIFQPYSAGAVPVYLGTLDAKKFVPPHSAIFTSDFPSPEAVATFLKYVLANETAYAEYHAWRDKPLPDSFISAATTSKQHWPCGACRRARGHGKPGTKVRPKIVKPEGIEYI